VPVCQMIQSIAPPPPCWPVSGPPRGWPVTACIERGGRAGTEVVRNPAEPWQARQAIRPAAGFWRTPVGPVQGRAGPPGTRS